MHLVSKVIFTYIIHDNNGGIGDSFNTLQELKNIIKSAEYTTPFQINIQRQINIHDTDAGKSGWYNNKESKIMGEHVNIIVADKLLYPNDVRTMLMEKYGSLLNFDNCISTDVKPVLFSGVDKETKFGLRKNMRSGMNSIDLSDSAIGNPTKYNLYHVHCRYLDNKDIVMNKNMEQIWPAKTGVMPLELSQLLARKTEKIYEG